MGERIELLRWVPPSATIEKDGQAEERKGGNVADRASRCRLSRVPTLQCSALHCSTVQVVAAVQWCPSAKSLNSPRLQWKGGGVMMAPRVEGSGNAD